LRQQCILSSLFCLILPQTSGTTETASVLPKSSRCSPSALFRKHHSAA